MIRIHVWFPHGTQVGHAAAQIGHVDDADSYVSWWPSDPARWKEVRAGAANSYEADKDSEKRDSDEQRLLYGLDEPAAKRWWGSLRQRQGSYAATTHNCAWAVISMLKAAGGDKYIHWTRTLSKYNVSLGMFIPMVCAIGSARGGGMTVVDNCTQIWTPSDVLRYADAVIHGQNHSVAPPGRCAAR